MDIKIFTELVKEELEKITECHLEIKCTVKNNGVVLTGIEFKDSDINIAPIVYMEGYYKAFQNGSSMSELIHRLYEEYKSYRVTESINLHYLIDFENIKDRITYILVNHDMNKNMLEEYPHTDFLDLAKLYVINISDLKEGTATIKISHALLCLWDKNIEEIDLLATENTERLFPVQSDRLDMIVKAMMLHGLGEDNISEDMQSWLLSADDSMLYVVTNQLMINGAGVMCYQNVLKNLADRLNSDLYILPCSLHQILVITTEGISKYVLQDMVFTVNRGKDISRELILSDNIYLYSREKDCIEIA
ncbi:MAG: hypothetical protein IJN64_18500 [Lachnospiraceae bacterium]|nr:hypothetical protein [Lachnospiraceae bacterium]